MSTACGPQPDRLPRTGWQRSTVAALLALAGAVTSPTQAGDQIAMSANYAWDSGKSREYLEASRQVDDLNTVDEEDTVAVKSSSYWEVRYTDPHPDPIPEGATLASVVVTVQYRMGVGWSGTLGLEARTADKFLGTVTRPEHSTATVEIWDITNLVNGEADPPATVNDLRIRMANGGSRGVTWSYTKVDVAYFPNVPPGQPFITSPESDEVGVSRNPTAMSSAFTDPNGDTHASSDWEVYEDAGLSSRVASTLDDPTNLTSISVDPSDVAFEGTLAGKSSLAPLTDYWVRVRHTDSKGVSSPWSVPIHFVTATNQSPSEPLIVSPAADQADVSRNPTITADGFSDPDGDAHASSDWEVFEDGGLTLSVAYSMADTSNLASITVDEANVLFDGTLLGAESLAEFTDYWVRVTYRDDYGAASVSVAVRFTTGANQSPGKPSIMSPNADEAGVSRNATVTADAYTDPESDPHASSDWEVFEDGGLSSRVASSFNDPTSLDSISLDTGNVAFEGSLSGRRALAALTDYWVRVTYRDDKGSASVSAPLHFVTAENRGPEQPSITSPLADESDVSRSPSITSSTYSDPEGDEHMSSDWETYEDPGLTKRVVSSDEDTRNLTSIPVDAANVAFEGALLGKPCLAPMTQYWARVRYRDRGGVVSNWSSARHFITCPNQPPAQPAITAPEADQAGVSRCLTALASAFSDQENDAHVSSDWQIFEDASLTSRVGSSLEDAANLESISVDASSIAFEGALAGKSSLEPNTDYWAFVTYRDGYGGTSTSPVVHFTTGANEKPYRASISAPAQDETNVKLNPTLATLPYGDPDRDSHYSTDWEIYEDADLTARVAASLDDRANLTSITAEAEDMFFEAPLANRNSLDHSKGYWVRGRFKDDLGAAGDWSEALHFRTGPFPNGEGWTYYGGGCSPAQHGKGGPSRPPCSGLDSLAFILLAALVCRRKSSAVREGRPT